MPVHARILVAAAALALLTACSSGTDGGSSASGGTTTAAPTTTPSSAGGATASSGASSGSGGSESEAETQSITATEAEFTISLDEDTLTAGTYEITVKNEGHATHDLVVEQNGTDVAHGDLIGPGDSTKFSVDLAPGDYVLYCSVDNHRQLGMELAITVT